MIRKYDLSDILKWLDNERCGNSWASLAKRIGISRAYLSDVKLGHRMPGPKILNFLGLEAITFYAPPPLFKKKSSIFKVSKRSELPR